MVKYNASLSRLPSWTAAPGEDWPARATIDLTSGVDECQRAFEACDAGEPAVGFGEIYIQTGYDPSPAPPGSHLMSVFGQYAPYDLSEGDWESRRGDVERQFVELIGRFAPDSPTVWRSPRCSAPPTSRAGSASPAATSSRAR